MFVESGPAPSLGILHILEDTLALVRGGELDADRRGYVLRESKAFFEQVKEGAGSSRVASKKFSGPTRLRARESFALATRYLADSRSRLDPKSLEVVENAVDQLIAGHNLPNNATAVATLANLCERMSRDLSQGIVDVVENERRLGT